MTFGNPIWLWLIPLALLATIGAHIAAARARKRALERFAAPQLLKGLLTAYSIGKNRFKAFLFALGLCCVLLALARPQVGYEWQEVRARGVDLVIAMDVSKSMLARDIRPDRLERAKLAVLDLMGKLKGDRIGLVAFAGEAFLQCPLTLDYDAFRQSLEAVEPSLIPREGTDLGLAIAESCAAFDAGKNEKIIVLITDGEDLEGKGLAQAKQAAKKDIIIYAVGVGTPQGELIPIKDERGRDDFLRDPQTGKLVNSKLEDSTLSAIAEAAHGFYTPLGPAGEGLLKVYESGWNTLPQQDLTSRQQRKPIERFQWPLALGIFLLAWEPLIGTRKRHFLKLFRRASIWIAAAGLAAAIFTQDIRAQEAAQESAQETPQEASAPIPEASDAPHAPTASPDGRLDYNYGTQLYREGDYAQAAKAFTEALAKQTPELQKDTFFNLGNTRFMQGLSTAQSDPKGTIATWENALKDYDNALELFPSDKDAAHNRAIVEKYLEELKKQEEEKQKQQQNQQNQQNSQSQQDQNQSQQDSQQNQQQSQNQSSSSQNQNHSQNQDSSQSQEQNKQDKQNSQNQNSQDQNQSRQDSQQNQQQSQDPSSSKDQNHSQNQDSAQSQEQEKQDKQDSQNQNSQNQNQSRQDSQQNQQQSQDPSASSQDQNKAQNQEASQSQEQEKQDKQEAQSQASNDAQQPKPKEEDSDQVSPQNSAQAGQNRDMEEQRGPDNRGVADAREEEEASQSPSPAAQAQGGQGEQAQEEAAAAQQGDQPGVMSRQDAGFLLDSLKSKERKLPAAASALSGDNENRRDVDKPLKNW